MGTISKMFRAANYCLEKALKAGGALPEMLRAAVRQLRRAELRTSQPTRSKAPGTSLLQVSPRLFHSRTHHPCPCPYALAGGSGDSERKETGGGVKIKRNSEKRWGPGAQDRGTHSHGWLRGSPAAGPAVAGSLQTLTAGAWLSPRSLFLLQRPLAPCRQGTGEVRRVTELGQPWSPAPALSP